MSKSHYEQAATGGGKLGPGGGNPGPRREIEIILTAAILIEATILLFLIRRDSYTPKGKFLNG